MRKSRLNHHIQSRLIEHFVAGTTARCAAELVGVNRKTAACYFQRLREIIAMELEDQADEIFHGEIELDESYSGGKRRGKRGRGASGKVSVFDILKRNGKVYTDYWRGYNALDVAEFKHYRINHSKLFANKHNHINGIENFWNRAKRHMPKFNGVQRAQFGLFLKECEWRFNST